MAKLKFIEAIIIRFKAFKIGISSNPTVWAGQADTPVTVQAHIDALETVDVEIASLETQLTQKRQAAKLLANQKEAIADAVQLKVKGIHATATNKWPEYGVTDPNAAAEAARSTRPVPEKAVIKNIVDDYDGIGFIVELEGLKEADSYEVQRGAGATAANVNTYLYLVTCVMCAN